MDRITYLSSPNNKVLFSSCPQVSHNLNVAYGVENVFPLLFIYKSVQILDQPDTELTAHLKDCCRFITQAQEEVSPPPLHSLLLQHFTYTSKHIPLHLHLYKYTDTLILTHLHFYSYTSTSTHLHLCTAQNTQLHCYTATPSHLHLSYYTPTPLYLFY